MLGQYGLADLDTVDKYGYLDGIDAVTPNNSDNEESK